MLQENPRVSIVIPVCDRAPLVAETLSSVLRQSSPAWEAVVVDDGSGEATLRLLAEHERSDPRIRVLRRDRPPKGANACRNIGLAATRAEHVMFLDSDDLIAETCLARRAEASQQEPSADFLVFQGLIFSNVPGDGGGMVWNTSNDEPDLWRFIRGDSVWQTTGPLWKRSAVQQLGGFDEDLTCWQDVDIHARALLLGLKYVKRFERGPDFFYRKHGVGTISQRGLKSRESVASVLRVCEKMAIALGNHAEPEATRSLRQALGFALQLALDNRHFDLAHRAITRGKRDRLLSSQDVALSKLAAALYAAHSRGLRGCARLGKRLMRRFLPQELRSGTS